METLLTLAVIVLGVLLWRMGERLARVERDLARLRLPIMADALAHVRAAASPVPRPESGFEAPGIQPQPAASAAWHTGLGDAAPALADAAATRPGLPANASELPGPPPLPEPERERSRAQTHVPVAPPARPAKISWPQRAVAAIREWVSTGNVPVKIGMLVLLAGVAALLKYASDQGWLRLPIQYRLLGVALAALGGLGLGWRQRTARPAFGLALQGGAIGVLLLVVFAATRLYPLLPQGLAFALSVVLVAGMGVLAVVQGSLALAALATLAGFMAPIWLSNGTGSHVALFTYYAILNSGIFAMAQRRPWRVLVLLGFVFTFGIGVAWGVLHYSPALYASTQPFLVLFFLIYLAIPLLQARSSKARWRDPLSGSLLFGLPLVTLLLQSRLLAGEPMPLAFCAVGLAGIYAGLAAWMRQRDQVLHEAYALLALSFSTLAIPLAFSAGTTAAAYAVEGAMLAWFGLRQQRPWPLWIGVGLQLVAGWLGLGSFLDDWLAAPAAQGGWPFLNGPAMTGLLLAGAGWVTAAQFWRRKPVVWAAALYLWGLGWWLVTGIGQDARFATPSTVLHWLLVLTTMTAWLAAESWVRLQARALMWTASAGLLLAVPILLAQVGAYGDPLQAGGWVAWLVYGVLGWRSLRLLARGSDAFTRTGQVGWWLTWPLVLSAWLGVMAHRQALADGWQYAAWVVPWLAAAALLLVRGTALARFGGGSAEERARLVSTVLRVMQAMLGIGFVVGLAMEGSPAPLPWLPVLNPLELLQLGTLLVALRWLREGGYAALAGHTWLLMGMAAFAWLTMSALRSVHTWGGIAWAPEALTGSQMAQTTLTLLWSVLGVLGWVIGSRRGERGLWRAGALLMGLVLVKLVLIDRGHLGNLFGIGSFIAYGLLCTVIGYFAPAPPKQQNHMHEEPPRPDIGPAPIPAARMRADAPEPP